jgi:membrane-bound lytic murein transglycosylase D
MNRPVILAAGTPQILLPYDSAKPIRRELPLLPRAADELDDVDRAAQHEAGGGARATSEWTRTCCARSTRIPPRVVISSRLDAARARRNTAIAIVDVSSTSPTTRPMCSRPRRRRLRKMSLRAGKNDSVDSIARRYT